ncbi:hypothetical protein RHSIM_Rhsim02G0052900 [Rhododendron simsii]|uniref:S-protein homolog n=1 Tax=Rhododendron simsii TaxID=118357 RepID=A0A834HA40_RHOSS|nr:hypothetical protein RHSIM_Rhsim02G0052900 [Rhododendron simsii]
MSHPKSYLLMLALTITAMHLSSVESLTLASGSIIVVNVLPAYLTIHCWSNTGNDLGTQTVLDRFTWNASIVAGRKNEVYTCDLGEGGLHGRFSLFDVARDWNKDRCGFRNFRCYWEVRTDGIYQYFSKSQSFELQYRW